MRPNCLFGLLLGLSSSVIGQAQGRLDGRLRPRLDSLLERLRVAGHSPWLVGEIRNTVAELASSVSDGPLTHRLAGRPAGAAGSDSVWEPSGWLGVMSDAAPLMERSRNGVVLTYHRFPRIIGVTPNSPARLAGVRSGDILLAYNDTPVVDRPVNLTQLLRPGRKLAITVRRDGAERRYDVIVAAAVDSGFQTNPKPFGCAIDRCDRRQLARADLLRERGVVLPSAGSKIATELSPLDADLGRAFGVSTGLLVLAATSIDGGHVDSLQPG